MHLPTQPRVSRRCYGQGINDPLGNADLACVHGGNADKNRNSMLNLEIRGVWESGLVQLIQS